MDQKTLSEKRINIFREIKEQQLKSTGSVLKGREGEAERGREKEIIRRNQHKEFQKKFFKMRRSCLPEIRFLKMTWTW